LLIGSPIIGFVFYCLFSSFFWFGFLSPLFCPCFSAHVVSSAYPSFGINRLAITTAGVSLAVLILKKTV
jgi:hypothetical protein